MLCSQVHKSKTSIAKKNPYPLQNNDGNCWLESKPILNACLGYISDEIHFLMVSYIKCELTVGQPDNSLYCRNYSTLTKRMSNICVVQPCFHRGAVLFKINLAKPERMRVWLQQYISYYCFSQSFLLISQSHFSGCSAHQAQVFAQLTTWQPVHHQTIKWSNFLISTYPNLCTLFCSWLKNINSYQVILLSAVPITVIILTAPPTNPCCDVGERGAYL